MIDLDDDEALDACLVGSKAGNLAALRRAGERVPDGLVVLPRADATLAAATAMRRFGDVPLAVRSSSISEDLAAASFAGQYLTVLDVRGPNAITDAIVQVRRSAGNAAARGYGDSGQADMPVLIMPLVPADAAGVAFTVNPVTGDDEIVIDAIPGLAEDLVSGAATPQRWIVAGESSRSHDGGPEAIDAAQAREIATLAQRVAALRGAPQDIEWAIAAGTLYLLQARPITALPVAPLIEVPAKQTWIREDEHFGRPLRPLEFDVLAPRTDEATRKVFAELGFPVESLRQRLIGGWPYARMVPPMDSGKDSDKAPPALLFGLVIRLVPPLRRRLRRAAEVVESNLCETLVDAWESHIRAELRGRARALRAVDLSELTDAELANHLEVVLASLQEASDHHTRLGFVSFLEQGRLGVFVDRELGWTPNQTSDLLQGFSAATSKGGRALDALASAIAADPDAVQLLDRDDQALLAHPGPGGIALRDYLDNHGHEIVGFDLSHPTYAEAPQPLLGLVRRRIARGNAVGRDVRADAARAAQRARAALADRPAVLERFERLLAGARRARPCNDDTETDVLEALGSIRYVAVEVGRRLAAHQVLPDLDAVSFLQVDELLTALRGGRLEVDIERRRGELRWAQAHPGPRRYGPAPPPQPSLRFVPAWSRPFLEIMMWVMSQLQPAPREAPAGGALQGVPASPGRVKGPVRIIRAPDEFHRIRPDDILVCPMTWAAWSVVFPLVSAVVTELGGPLSHPAILAREFGIPAVVSVPDVTSLLRDGQTVTIDGAAGTIELEELSGN